MTNALSRGRPAFPLPPWRQLPARSPLSLGALARASVPGADIDPRELLGLALAREFSADGVMLLESGTQALTVALSMSGSTGSRAPRVALPAFGCYDLASAAVGADADVALYDVDPGTLSPDPESLDRALAVGVDVVVVVHLFGIPVSWEGIASRVRSAGALLVEDAAQGHGGTLGGRPLGSLGDVSVLSFGRGKGWTGGGGGALLVRGGLGLPEAPAVRGERSPLLGAWVQWALGRPTLFGLPHMIPWLRLGETVYHPPSAPARMGRGPASLVLGTGPMAREEAVARRRAGEGYRARLQGRRGVDLISHPPESVPGYLRFPLRILEGADRVLERPGARRAGLAATYPGPLSELPPLRDRLRGATTFHGAETLVRELLTLPTHGLLSERDRERVLALAAPDLPS